MFPIDSEFTLLYLLYFLLFTWIVYQTTKSKRANQIRLSLIIVISLSLNIMLFLNPENFKGGGSLVVLFYSGILLLLTFITTIINQIFYKYILSREKSV